MDKNPSKRLYMYLLHLALGISQISAVDLIEAQRIMYIVLYQKQRNRDDACERELYIRTYMDIDINEATLAAPVHAIW